MSKKDLLFIKNYSNNFIKKLESSSNNFLYKNLVKVKKILLLKKKIKKMYL